MFYGSSFKGKAFVMKKSFFVAVLIFSLAVIWVLSGVIGDKKK